MNLIENSLSNINYTKLIRNFSDTSKGDFGSVLIIGGNTGMLGSIHLAGRSAMLMGAGRVALAPLNLQHSIDIMMPELMIKSLSEVLPILNKFTVIVIGPGFGLDEYAQSILTQILEYPYSPTSKLIFDADALNLIASHDNLRTKFTALLPFNKVVTPHKGEAMRLLSDKYNVVKDSRIDIVKKISQLYQCTTLLKGHESLICAQDKHSIFINKTGNQALSSAGQGDTLCGLIAGLAAQGVSLLIALQFAVYLHGLAADHLVVKHQGYNGLLASEIAWCCRDLLNKILYQ